ncbi:MAG: hypothetical protein BWZ01_02674 [Deltaproteobacteria bacterium ADurb.BinA179]|nr:MAG: hypothetical protein BWZ01_02674 [Deltaproteobacteria bacterium ADurb.BinA179]
MIIAGRETCRDHLISGLQRTGDDAGLDDVREVSEHHPLGICPGGNHNDPGVCGEIGCNQYGADPLFFLERADVDDGNALQSAVPLGNLIHLGVVDPAGIGEIEYRRMVGSDEDMLDEIVVGSQTASDTDAATLLCSVFVELGALYISLPRHGDDHLLIGDEILDIEVRS